MTRERLKMNMMDWGPGAVMEDQLRGQWQKYNWKWNMEDCNWKWNIEDCNWKWNMED